MLSIRKPVVDKTETFAHIECLSYFMEAGNIINKDKLIWKSWDFQKKSNMD